MTKKIISMLLIAVILLSGCSNKTIDNDEPMKPSEPTDESVPADESSGENTEPELAKYEFDPHLYLPILDDDIPQDYWDSFYNLCDALRAGETTFVCSSEEAYKWATDPAILNQLFPAACTKIKGVSNDGSIPFENGVGRIYYDMPIDEYVLRQKQFEDMVVYQLNTYIEPDDDDFEKCLKLFDYMSASYTYQYDFIEQLPDGSTYYTMLTNNGICFDLASVYAYFLLQAGIEAMVVEGDAPDMSHAWDYIVIEGEGYYADPTWTLRSAADGEDLCLDYFLMDGDRRADYGFDLDDMTAPLLPKYWVQFSSVRFVAENDKYCLPLGSYLKSIDEENKILYYVYYGEELEFNYAQAN